MTKYSKRGSSCLLFSMCGEKYIRKISKQTENITISWFYEEFTCVNDLSAVLNQHLCTYCGYMMMCTD